MTGFTEERKDYKIVFIVKPPISLAHLLSLFTFPTNLSYKRVILFWHNHMSTIHSVRFCFVFP